VNRQAAARLRRLVAALAAVTCAVLASAAIAPAALAKPLPSPDCCDAPVTNVSTPVITGGGMPGWQIILIAVGAALAGAAVAILLDRVRTARRAASASTA
jgi:hypothetical protein